MGSKVILARGIEKDCGERNTHYRTLPMTMLALTFMMLAVPLCAIEPLPQWPAHLSTSSDNSGSGLNDCTVDMVNTDGPAVMDGLEADTSGIDCPNMYVPGLVDDKVALQGGMAGSIAGCSQLPGLEPVSHLGHENGQDVAVSQVHDEKDQCREKTLEQYNESKQGEALRFDRANNMDIEHEDADNGPRVAGLLSRQSEITESILLLERQIRQAELIGRLLEIFGPDTRIEILPGQYISYADTPAGQKVAAELAVNEYQRQITQLQMQAEIRSAENRLRGLQHSLQATDSIAGIPAISADQEMAKPGVRIHEIGGLDGNYQAIISLDGIRRHVEAGDKIEGLGKIIDIGRSSLQLLSDGTSMRLHIGN